MEHSLVLEETTRKKIDELMLDDYPVIKSNKKIEYINLPMVFDIETSSFYRLVRDETVLQVETPSEKDQKNWEKCNTMYAFIFGVFGRSIIGRTWKQFTDWMDAICDYYKTDINRRIVVYVHNLAYEMQYIRRLFHWEKVFAVDERKPLYALTTRGIEFRCSYQLSGYSLKELGENLTKYKTQKMVGDLDYSLIRHSKTPLTDKEIGYIIHDALVPMAYIQEQIEQCGDLSRIPYTKTGFVRNFMRESCLYEGSHKHNQKKFWNYRDMMRGIEIKSEEEYHMLRDHVFHGGFTHANAMCVGVVQRDVISKDFTSSYPAVLVIEDEFPIATGKKIQLRDSKEFYDCLKKYACVFECTFVNIRAIVTYENPISESKCTILRNQVMNNGRVVEADLLQTCMTNIDFSYMNKFYAWDKLYINNMRIYRKGYLPKDFVLGVLTLYANKTKLKGIDEEIVNYFRNKSMCNAAFGMTVTDICRPEYKYINDEWVIEAPDFEKSLKQYNNSPKRFLAYQWGVFCTALAQRNLFSGIYECKEDYLYADTDSVKIINYEKHEKYFEEYNKRCIEKLIKALDHHGLPHELGFPKTIKGEEKPLGVWSDDGHYPMFKTLGAKRYLYTDDKGKLHLTCAGVSKTATDWMMRKFKTVDGCFRAFDNNLYFPPEATGKNTHTYIDEFRGGYIKDYLGNESEFSEMSSVHMEGASYSLSMSDMFLEYILGLREE